MYDICIVGAGVAGASIAAHLSKLNYSIALMDISFKERDRIVGELMQPGGLMMMQKLGIGHVINNIETSKVKGYSLHYNNKNLVIDYGNDQFGVGLNNGKFIQALRNETLNQSNVKRILGKALDFSYKNDDEIEGVIYEDEKKDKQTIQAKLTIVCDGFFSTLRSKLIDDQKVISSYFLGLILKDCQLPNEQYGHIFLDGKSPFLCYRINENEVRLLLDYQGNKAPVLNKDLKEFIYQEVAPYVNENMKQSLQEAINTQAVKIMPNHKLSVVSCTKKGVAMVGDSLNMRHPLTGGGMTATLTDVALLSKVLNKTEILDDKIKLNQQIQHYYKERLQWNASINILADALYKVTLNDGLKEACFDYLSKGADKSQEPIQLLAGISRDKGMLLKHFTQVAVLGAKDKLFRDFSIHGIDISYTMLKEATQIFWPLLKKEKNMITGLINEPNVEQLEVAS
ncbi:MAG: FAD-dependent monooxygenase [Bacteroidetes bacterium]|nr:FAD-dependent monooxygenase [Bacteroidota bacterium]MCB9227136.1 FAD-dependent monooxygenase [Chitinophagales bacterium]